MEKGKLKLFAAALVMTMLCSVAIVAIDAGDDIDGANKTVDYQFNLQLNNGTDKLVDDLKTTADEVSKDNYVKSLKKVLDDAGYTYEIKDSGWITSITKDGKKYASSGDFGVPGYYGFALYYPSSGGWATTITYDEHSIFSIVLDEYKFTDPHSDKYLDSNYNYWTLLPTKNPIDFTDGMYHFNLQLNNGTDKVQLWLDGVKAEKLSSEDFTACLKAALDKVKYTYEISGTWITSITTDKGVVFKSTGTYLQDDYYGFALYYGNGTTWTPTNNYSEGNIMSIVLDNYKFTDPKSDDYYDSGFGYWTLLPTDSPGDYDKGGNDNLFLYIGIAVVAIIVIAIVAIVLMKKGKSPA